MILEPEAESDHHIWYTVVSMKKRKKRKGREEERRSLSTLSTLALVLASRRYSDEKGR